MNFSYRFVQPLFPLRFCLNQRNRYSSVVFILNSLFVGAGLLFFSSMGLSFLYFCNSVLNSSSSTVCQCQEAVRSKKQPLQDDGSSCFSSTGCSFWKQSTTRNWQQFSTPNYQNCRRQPG